MPNKALKPKGDYMNRYTNQFQYTYEKDTVTIYGAFTVGSSGAVASIEGGGLGSVTKESAAGQYSIELSDAFQRLLFVDAVIVDDDISQIVKHQILEVGSSLQTDFKADKTFKIQFLGATAADDTAQIAANLASGAKVMLKIVCRRTSVGPYDV